MIRSCSKQQLLVLVGACFFQCALIGVLVNSAGVLFAQIREDLAMPMTRISSYNAVRGIVGAFAGVFMTNLFFRMKKSIYMGITILLVVGGYLVLIPGANSDVIWYASSVLAGASFCVSSVMVPYVLDRWFPENAGTATGIAMAFSGLGGILFNPVCAWLIGRFGWQMAILILGGITTFMGLAALIPMFCFPMPEQPAAAGSVASKAEAETRAFPWKTFLLCALSLLAGIVCMQFCQYAAMFSQDAGYSLQTGASLTAVFMAGNVGGKLLFGWVCDRIGIYKTMVASMICITLGSLIFLLFQQQLVMLYIGFILYGNVYGLTMISLSRCCIATYGHQGVKRYMGLHNSINGFLQAGAALSVGLLFDATGSFDAQLMMGIGLMVLSSWAALTLERRNKH